MAVRGIAIGDNKLITWYESNTLNGCKRWLRKRDLYLFTYLVICDDNGQIIEQIR